MFTDYVWVPVAAPKIELDEDNRKRFIEMVDVHSKRIDGEFPKKIDYPWNILVLRSETREPGPGELPGSGWHDFIRKEFPELVHNVEHLPFESLKSVFVMDQIIDVKPHLDDGTRERNHSIEPASYRYELINDAPGESFYFVNGKGNRIFITLPESTNLWCHSNIHGVHGAIKVERPRRKLLLAVWGTLHVEKHLNLIQKSIETYPDKCIKYTDLL